MTDLFMRGQMTAHINSFTGNVFSFDYGIKEKVNVAAVQPSSYGCTSAVWQVLKKLELLDAYASFQFVFKIVKNRLKLGKNTNYSLKWFNNNCFNL